MHAKDDSSNVCWKERYFNNREKFLYHKKTKLQGSFPISRVNIKFTKIVKLGGHSLAINLTLYTYMQTHTCKGGNQNSRPRLAQNTSLYHSILKSHFKKLYCR